MKVQNYKVKDNNYIDSSSIMHNRKKLNEILDSNGIEIGNASVSLNNDGVGLLYDGDDRIILSAWFSKVANGYCNPYYYPDGKNWYVNCKSFNNLVLSGIYSINYAYIKR